jgi:multisubunit Na+/H+ antiporter MnhB subunit
MTTIRRRFVKAVAASIMLFLILLFFICGIAPYVIALHFIHKYW